MPSKVQRGITSVADGTLKVAPDVGDYVTMLTQAVATQLMLRLYGDRPYIMNEMHTLFTHYADSRHFIPADI